MKWQQIVHDYFSFTWKERIGIIAIITLIVIVWFLPQLISSKTKNKISLGDTSWISEAKKLERKNEESSEKRNFTTGNDGEYNYSFQKPLNSYFNKQKGELFYFDPNNLPTEGWQRLGIRDKTIQTIQNYLSKGGKFKKPEDLQRVYGLHQDEYERISPYIKIEESIDTKNSENQNSKSEDFARPLSTNTSRYSVIDINLADTIAFISLPGIGSKLAARIVNFRDKLGGFYSVDQVGETYGLPDSTFQKIKQYLKLENKSVKKININTSTVDELKVHPYIKYSLANPIVAYRNEHGPFTKVEDLKKVMVVTEEIFKRVAPYLTE
ncbi:MAG: helix-hairpin-helix domain-containing protein [Chitinophagaceae bacterium]|nr:MAG: helix-hairpin-helix domain-containing protein [Chitinophagaceae bacterium]